MDSLEDLFSNDGNIIGVLDERGNFLRTAIVALLEECGIEQELQNKLSDPNYSPTGRVEMEEIVAAIHALKNENLYELQAIADYFCHRHPTSLMSEAKQNLKRKVGLERYSCSQHLEAVRNVLRLYGIYPSTSNGSHIYKYTD